jgi:hypothetical protein
MAIALSGTGTLADDYKVRDLLEPCVEGDNDSRGGAVLEMECEQYITGFTDLYIRAGLAKKDKICLPPEGNRADEIRWAFMRWAHENFGKRDIPAVDGLLATLKWKFKCK